MLYCRLHVLPSQPVTSSVVIYGFSLDMILGCRRRRTASYLIKFFARKLAYFFSFLFFSLPSVYVSAGRFAINARARTPTRPKQISVGQKTPRPDRFTRTFIISLANSKDTY